MIKKFYEDAGVLVIDAYWIGSIGPHSTSVANLIWKKLEQDVMQPQTITDISQARIKRAQHSAKFSAKRLDFLNDEFNALTSLPGINEMVKESIDTDSNIDIGYMNSDWIECEDSPEDDGHAPGSLLVCLQAPRGCILSAGDAQMQLRMGDVVLVNNANRYSLIQKFTHSMGKLDPIEKLAWLKKEGMLFMTINRRAA